jgi:hypothetical protein
LKARHVEREFSDKALLSTIGTPLEEVLKGTGALFLAGAISLIILLAFLFLSIRLASRMMQ